MNNDDELGNELEKLIKEKINKAGWDHNMEDILYQMEQEKAINEYDDDITNADWIAEGKYEYCDCSYLISTNYGDYVLTVGLSRSGSYYTDYHYNEPTFIDFVSKSEFYAPKIKLSFVYKGSTINIMDDNTVKVDNNIYSSVEEAIDEVIAQLE